MTYVGQWNTILGLEAIASHGSYNSFSSSFPTYLSTTVVTILIYFFFPTYVLLITYVFHFTSLTVLFVIINSTPDLLFCISCSIYYSALHSVPPIMRHLDTRICMDHFGLQLNYPQVLYYISCIYLSSCVLHHHLGIAYFVLIILWWL